MSNGENELTFIEKVKNRLRNTDTKLVIKIFVLLLGFGLTVVLTITQLGFDPENININDWLSKSILNLGLIIFGMIMGESIADDRQRALPNGLYQKRLKDYQETLTSISIINIYFSEFLIWFTAKETINKRVNYLLDNGIKEAKDIVKYLDVNDVDELKERPIKLENGRIVTKKSEGAIAIIKHALDGSIVVHGSPANYYTTVFEGTKTKSELEVGKEIELQKQFTQGVLRTCKICSAFIISLLWSATTVGEFMNAGDMQAWVNLVSRITGIMGGLFTGYCTGVSTVKLDAKKIENKTTVLNKFKIAYNTREFVPTDYDDLARQEYDNYLNNNATINNEETNV